MKTYRKLFSSAAAVTFLALLNAGITYVVQVVLAAHFGTGHEMDVYLAAWALPLLVATAVADAISLTLIPIFVELWLQEEIQAWRMTNSVVTVMLAASIAVSIVLSIFAAQCINVMAPGLAASPKALGASLLRLLSPAIGCLALSSLLTAAYNARGRFVQPAWAPVVNAVTMLLGIVVAVPQLGIYGVALATTLGAAARLLWLSPILFEGRRVGRYFGWSHPGIGRLWKLTYPLMLAGLLYKGNLVVERFIGSWMPAGSIASLGYAYQITLLLGVLASQGLGITLMPQMSSDATVEGGSQVGATLAKGICWTVMIITPIVLGVAVLREPIIRLLFQRGQFNESSVRGTELALLGYLGAVYAGGLANLPSRAFIAIQDVWTPIRIGLIGAVVLIVLDVLLAHWFGFIGLALSYSVMSFFTLSLWFLAIRRQFKAFDWTRVIFWGKAALITSLGMAVFCHFLNVLLVKVLADSKTGITAELAVVGVVGSAIYAVLMKGYLQWKGGVVERP